MTWGDMTPEERLAVPVGSELRVEAKGHSWVRVREGARGWVLLPDDVAYVGRADIPDDAVLVRSGWPAERGPR